MKNVWILSCAAVLLTAVGLVAAPGCASDPCEELGNMCSGCPNPDYVAQCEAAAASGNETVCQSQVNAFDAYCAGSNVDGGVGGGLPTCALGETACPPGVCTTPANDPANCGACGNVCSADQVCALGQCADSCPEPLQPCDGGCVNLQADGDHCGSCNSACTAGQICSEGGCADSCETAEDGQYPTECADGCVNLASDPQHCGACGAACQNGQVCSAGACQGTCGDGLTSCCGLCVNTMQSPEHCGGCDPIACPTGTGGGGGSAGGAGGAGGAAATGGAGGAAGGATGGAGGGAVVPSGPPCEDPAACLKGQCVLDCAAYTDCGGSCVDLNADRFNCGACGTVCADTDVCSDGVCGPSCEDGETNCFGACVDIDANAQHCGACGNSCAATEVCSHASCLISCQSGQEECPELSGNCVDTTTNPEHCGSCSNQCGDTTPLCSAGSCVSGCPTGDTNCAGACVDLDENFDNCGSCGNSCNDDSICTVDRCDGQGTCENTSGALVCNDGNQCTMDLCDPQAGCYSEELTQQQVAQLCGQTAPPGSCIFCDPDGSTCNVVPEDDGIGCTDDACPESAVFTPDEINTPNDGNCTASCAPACVPTDPNADAATGCVEQDGLCTETCADICDLDGSDVDPASGCQQEDGPCSSGACSTQPGTACDISDPSRDTCGCI